MKNQIKPVQNCQGSCCIKQWERLVSLQVCPMIMMLNNAIPKDLEHNHEIEWNNLQQFNDRWGIKQWWI